jgi:hypothetical protein
MFVDLAQKGYLEYGYTNNLGIKYALTVPNEEFTKATGITDPKKIQKIRYELTSIKFLPRDIFFDTQNKALAQKMYSEAIDAFYKILVYRLHKALNGDPVEFASDLMDVNGYYIKDVQSLLANGISPI